MINISNAARDLLIDNQTTRFKATIRLANNTTINITGVDVMADSVSFKDSCASSSAFSVGSAIINSFSFTLNNITGKFNGVDFTNAVITPYIGIPLSTIEWIQKGIYIVEKPTSIGDTIPLNCIDNMSKLEKPFKKANFSGYNQESITLGNALRVLATSCGVTFDAYTFTGSSDVVNLKLDNSDTMSCLDVLCFILQMCGYYAKATRTGTIKLAWFDKSIWANVSNLDGGDFDYTNTGNVVDGGNFSYGSQNVIDGGTFSYGNYIPLYAFNDFTIATEDITITGVRVKASDDEDTEVSSGTDGYVIAISDNPLILKANVNTICTRLASLLVGFKFRPYNISALSDVTAESGDPVRITDRNGKMYYSYITSCAYSFGNYQNFAFNAETVSENNATEFTALTKAVNKLRTETENEFTAYDKAVQAMNMLASNMMGCYFGYSTDVNGGVVCYSSNKPFTYSADGTEVTGCTLRSSVWKRNSNGYFICSDAQSTNLNNLTFTSGVDNTGAITARVIATIGLNADWVNAGSIKADQLKTNVISAVNSGTGTIDDGKLNIASTTIFKKINGNTTDTTTINGGKITSGSITATQIAANAVTADKIKGQSISTGKLSFTPLVSKDSSTGSIVGTINASTEGLAIDASKVSITGTMVCNAVNGKTGQTTIDGGKITSKTITATQLNFTPTDSSNVIATINGSSESLSIETGKLNLTGYITATDVGKTGTTTIDGARISTGTLSASTIKGGTLTLGGKDSTGTENVNGVCSVKDTNNVEKVKLDKSGITATAGTIGGWNLDSSGYYYDNDNDSSHRTWIKRKQIDLIKVNGSSYNRIKLDNDNGHLIVDSPSGSDRGIWVTRQGGLVIPDTNENDTIRVQHNKIERWVPSKSYNKSYAMWSGTDDTSDIRLKTDIENISREKIKELFEKLTPIQFRYKPETEIKHMHFGLSAQEVVNVLDDLGYSDNEIITEGVDDEYYRLHYHEMHGFEIAGIKYLYEKIDEQQKEINELKSLVNKLIEKVGE